MINPNEHTSAIGQAGSLRLSEVVVEPPHRLINLNLSELWRFRELLFFFIWRDIKVRYKQTLLGVAWAVLQPVITMIVFSVIFGQLANMSTGDIPYPIFLYAGLLPWQLFSRALTEAASSLILNQNMVTKVYFPRSILPASSVLGGLVDFGIAFIILLGLMIYYQVPFSWQLLLLPFFIIIAIFTALAISLWLSALVVRYRDIKFITPFLVQIWLFVTPVVYPSTIIPQDWLWLYNLNPMNSVVAGFRWAIYGAPFSGDYWLLISASMIVVLLISGIMFFQHMELTFADLI
ncbi:MAG: phosphate ABC transporter permease [Chloroflexi bacterium HGW-Chloroflexi-6]|nr:MAG: phosphate ABC transporter permease [Chloroflexi bacterium HGW-Chloroflexi-6]